MLPACTAFSVQRIAAKLLAGDALISESAWRQVTRHIPCCSAVSVCTRAADAALESEASRPPMLATKPSRIAAWYSGTTSKPAMSCSSCAVHVTVSF